MVEIYAEKFHYRLLPERVFVVVPVNGQQQSCCCFAAVAAEGIGEACSINGDLDGEYLPKQQDSKNHQHCYFVESNLLAFEAQSDLSTNRLVTYSQDQRHLL